MRIHILGICGTFMGGLALLAKAAGHVVEGSDANVYPPMSVQLEAHGILLHEGYAAEHIDNNVDCVIIGNVVSRGNPAVEYVLSQQIPYLSGPEWLAKYVLKDKWVLAVAGTHGKTTTSSLLAHILDQAGFEPGFLIGGVPENFGVSARLGEGEYFVIEADEYDSAFFDKRAKFMHYHPKTLILNNLEFDHADIYANLAAIQQQFHYLVRTVPNNGLLVVNKTDSVLHEVLRKGYWTPLNYFGQDGDMTGEMTAATGQQFTVHCNNESRVVDWHLLGEHNMMNALASLLAAQHVGISLTTATNALTSFKNVKRRLELKSSHNGIDVYDDFAHHPTAIAATINALRAKIGQRRLIAILEFGSYTMKTGVHKHAIKDALQAADIIVCKQSPVDWGLEEVLAMCAQSTFILPNVDAILLFLQSNLQPQDVVLVMSNTGFEGIHHKIDELFLTQAIDFN